MAFTESIILEAWRRSGSRYECEREGHGHAGRCGVKLLASLRGGELGGGWDAVRRTALLARLAAPA